MLNEGFLSDDDDNDDAGDDDDGDDDDGDDDDGDDDNNNNKVNYNEDNNDKEKHDKDNNNKDNNNEDNHNQKILTKYTQKLKRKRRKKDLFGVGAIICSLQEGKRSPVWRIFFFNYLIVIATDNHVQF